MVNNTRPMDRLICGDVGFGKTEVAMRAIYRAHLSNKQVSLARTDQVDIVTAHLVMYGTTSVHAQIYYVSRIY